MYNPISKRHGKKDLVGNGFFIVLGLLFAEQKIETRNTREERSEIEIFVPDWMRHDEV